MKDARQQMTAADLTSAVRTALKWTLFLAAILLLGSERASPFLLWLEITALLATSSRSCRKATWREL